VHYWLCVVYVVCTFYSHPLFCARSVTKVHWLVDCVVLVLLCCGRVFRFCFSVGPFIMLGCVRHVVACVVLCFVACCALPRVLLCIALVFGGALVVGCCALICCALCLYVPCVAPLVIGVVRSLLGRVVRHWLALVIALWLSWLFLGCGLLMLLGAHCPRHYFGLCMSLICVVLVPGVALFLSLV